ncbi:hypothetical protein SLA2020_144300 [Shorea laevis]
MSTKSSLLIFFLCLSLHACNGRHIKEGPSSKSHFSAKVLGSSLQPMKMDSSVSRGAKGDDIVNTEESKSSLKEPVLHARKISGSHEIIKSSSHQGLHKATRIKGLRRQALSAVGCGSNTQGCNKEPHEDVAVTDYDPPHSDTPIHNRKINN